MYFYNTSKISLIFTLSTILIKLSAAVPIAESPTSSKSLTHPHIKDNLILFHATLEWKVALNIVKSGLISKGFGGDFNPAAGSGYGEVEKTVYLTDSWVSAAHYMCSLPQFKFTQVVGFSITGGNDLKEYNFPGKTELWEWLTGLFEDEEEEEDDDTDDEDDEDDEDGEGDEDIRSGTDAEKDKDSKNRKEMDAIYEKYDVISGPMSDPYSPLVEQYAFIKERARKQLKPIIAFQNIDCSRIDKDDKLKAADYRKGQWGDPEYSKYISEKLGFREIETIPMKTGPVPVYGTKKRKQTEDDDRNPTKKPNAGGV